MATIPACRSRRSAATRERSGHGSRRPPELGVEHLERRRAAALEMLGLVDQAHAAAAELTDEPVPGELGADLRLLGHWRPPRGPIVLGRSWGFPCGPNLPRLGARGRQPQLRARPSPRPAGLGLHAL